MNAEPRHPLFRQEVLRHRGDRLHGDVSIAVPVSWQALGFLLLAALATAAVFLATARYSRTETVAGAIVVDRGVAAVIPSRAGTVTDLPAREGQRVAAGAILARIRAEEDLSGGSSAPSKVIDSLRAQDGRLASQSGLILSAAAADRARLAAQAAGLAAELASIDQQIGEQQRLVRLAENEVLAAQTVAERGFLSRRDLEGRQSTLIGRRQQLAQLSQSRASRASALAEAQRAIAQSIAAAEAQAAGVESSRAALAQQLAQAEAAQGYALTAPVGGTVTTLTGRLGQAAVPGQPLMAIIPAGSQLRAELQVPTSAAGFLAPGQKVRLSIDAFPYQRFGTVGARIATVASVPVAKALPGGGSAPVYLVTADLDRPSVAAFGRLQPLVPGMTLSGRIVTRRQSLFEWLFEPLFAVARR